MRMRCDECGSTDIFKAWNFDIKTKKEKVKYGCVKCNHGWGDDF